MVITQLRDVESVVGGGSSSRANGHAVAVGTCLDNGGLRGVEGIPNSHDRNEIFGIKGAYSWPSLEMEFLHWVSFISR